MKFRTEISINPADFRITHDDKISVFGSCFAENIAKKLSDAGFTFDINPFGTVYNPASIARSLAGLIERRQYNLDALFQNEGLYHSFSHHSRFSGVNPDETLERINSRIRCSSDFLRKADILVITFGTAYVYVLRETGEIVSNCHKAPENRFRRYRLLVKDIVDEWMLLLDKLKSINPQIRVIFSVSPVRYLRDGFHENQLSKSTLLLAVNELTKFNPGSIYFPAYEILLDDLRDYRFYDDSLTHPTSKAIDYIWEKFSDAFFDKMTVQRAKDFFNTAKMLNHIPLRQRNVQIDILTDV
jgi:hypothetical protein